MTYYFEPPRDGEADNDDAYAPGLDDISPALLKRHGARVLRPTEAAVVGGQAPPRSTVYRARTLLIAGRLLADDDAVADIQDVLRGIGLRLATPGPAPGEDVPDLIRDLSPDLPRRVILIPLDPGEGGPPTVVIDAWVALQTLRAAAMAGRHEHLDEPAAGGIWLEHILVGSAITGSPASHGGGIAGTPASHGGGITGPGATDSYMYSGWDARTPVMVCADPPTRLQEGECVARYGRRPVVAVLDTGVRMHQWLDVQPGPPPADYGTVQDGFVAVEQDIQDAISLLAGGGGALPGPPIIYPYDQPVTAEPLVGELDEALGHGTFIAGIVRQIVPDARVLAIRIMHSDGIVYEGDLINALGCLAVRAAAGDPATMVDVVSLSLGYFSETPADQAYTLALWLAIEPLLALGIVTVAAAGNYATRRRFYPAAFADRATPPNEAPLISVGALNPDASTALFSDGGGWVRAWASGAAIVSTFPADVNGSRNPEIGLPDPHGGRASLDPDSYTTTHPAGFTTAGFGFAIWAGTSFSAPLLGAEIARALLPGAEAGLRLDDADPAAAVSRARQALQRAGWQG